MARRLSSRAHGRLAVAGMAALSCALAACLPGAAAAQIVESAAKPADPGVRLGQSVATRYRVGAQITARGGTVQNIRSMVAVPLSCPEQQVEMIEEDLSPNVEQFEYRDTDEGVRQMLIGVPQLSPREEAHAVAIYEVTTSPVLPPQDMSSLHAPAKPGIKLKRYLSRSPFIDVNHTKIRKAVKEALAADDEDDDEESAEAADVETSDDDTASESSETSKARESKPVETPQAGADDEEEAHTTTSEEKASDEKAPESLVVNDAVEAPAPTGPPSADWLRIEKLYDYARKKVKYEESVDKSSVQALADGKGDCQCIAALFVAMCRTEKVPARMVWADGHQYAEFYLEDAAGAGRWYPVESAGARAFGEMPTPRVILQKGDNFRVPERPHDRLRYASDYSLFLSKPDRQPKIAYVRESL